MNPLNLFKHLLPRAAAWSLTIDKPLRRFIDGLSVFVTDYRLFMDLVWLDIFPATTRELGAWESQFGLSAKSLSDTKRRDRLDGAWKAVGGQSPRYIQDTLQAAGFDVYVHEWWEPGTNPPVARNPFTYLDTGSVLIYNIECGDTDAECGEPDAECGGVIGGEGYPLVNIIQTTSKDYSSLCGEPDMACGEPIAECGQFLAFIFENKEYNLPVGTDTYPHYLYIGFEEFPDLAIVDASRRLEFETLCLKICPTQLWLGMLVTYA